MGCLLSYPGDGTDVSKSFADEQLVDVFSASNHCLSGKLGLHTYRPDVHLQYKSCQRIKCQKGPFPREEFAARGTQPLQCRGSEGQLEDFQAPK